MSDVEDIRLVERKIGRQWLITSPDVPGLYVAHADLETARKAVPSAVEMLGHMAERVRQRTRPAVDPT